MERGGIKLNKKFKPILSSDKRYIILTGGRGSAKSFTVSTLIEDLTFIADHVILFTRYTMTSAEISIIPEFTEKIDILGHESVFNINKKEIENKQTESSILFRGIKTSSGNQTANLKSIQGVTTFVVDEAEEFTNENDFDTIDYSVRSRKRQNRVIVILNPTTCEHWIYKRWFENTHKTEYIDGYPVQISTHPDVLHIHSTYLDNKEHLSESFLKQIESIKIHSPKKYGHKIIGGWLDKQEGVVFEHWKEGAFNNRLPYCFGLDYGFFPDPLALIRVAVDKREKKIYLKQEMYGTKFTDVQILDGFAEIMKRGDLIVCDINEPRTTDKIRKAGYNIQTAKKERIVDDIRDMQDYQLIVEPSSNSIKIELNNYTWNDKKASIPIDDYNHTLDAARYGFRRLITPGIRAGYRQ